MIEGSGDLIWECRSHAAIQYRMAGNYRGCMLNLVKSHNKPSEFNFCGFIFRDCHTNEQVALHMQLYIKSVWTDMACTVRGIVHATSDHPHAI